MRVYDGIAEKVSRLGDRGSAFVSRIRLSRERLVDALWDGWDRALGSVGARWKPMSHKIRVRRERLVDALWAGWDGSLDSVGARWGTLRESFRSRRDHRGGYRPERIGQSPGRRSWAIWGTSLCVVVMVTMAIVLLRDQTTPSAPPMAASLEPSVALGGVEVPDVRGMPASDARAELEHAGLKFAEPRAALGTPGVVLWTEPSIGRSVPSGTPVTIVIGVEAERLDSASS